VNAMAKRSTGVARIQIKVSRNRTKFANRSVTATYNEIIRTVGVEPLSAKQKVGLTSPNDPAAAVQNAGR